MWLPLLVVCFCTLAAADDATNEDASLRSPATVRIHYDRSSESRLEVSVDAFGKTHNLVLVEKFQPPVPVHELIFGQNGTVEMQDVTNNYKIGKFFEDESAGALLYMNDRNKLEGMLSDAIALSFENDEHVASDIRVKETSAFCGNEHHISLNEFAMNNYPINDENRAVRYAVEMLSVIDSSLNKQLGSNALNYLRAYWAKVAQLYTTATGVTVQIRFSRVLLSTSTKNYDSQMMSLDGSTHARIYETLEAFASFVAKYRSSLGIFDLAHLMTKRTFYKPSEGKTKVYLGLGYVGGVCRIDSETAFNTAVANDNGQYSGVKVSAHEIGHNLGSDHDGVGTSIACNSNTRYIMYPSMGPKNVLKFSSCSSAAFIKIYSQPTSSCLRSPII